MTTIATPANNSNALGFYGFEVEETRYSATPTVMDPPEKVAIFVDFDNVFKGFRESVAGIPEVFINFNEMGRLLAADRSVILKKAYGAKMQDFEIPGAYKSIVKAGFDQVLENCDGPVQKGVDVRLALELDDCSRETSCDNILLVSGDADFIPVVRRAQARGKKVQVAAFSNCLSHNLAAAADEVILLDELKILDVHLDISEAIKDAYSEVDVCMQ